MAGTLAEELQNARSALSGGQVEEAWRTLQPLLSWPADALSEAADLREALTLFAEVARAFAGDDLARLVAAVADDPSDAQALYDAGYQLYEHKLMPVAATLFHRAHRLAPGQLAIVGELAASLEGMMAYGPAALILDQSGLIESQPMLAYLSGFNWLMTGELDVPRQRLALLQGVEDGQIPFLRGALAGMLARADALIAAGIALDERALTAWQAVIDGTVLTHESPHGHDGPMFGRYAYVGDSPGLMREGIERLGAALQAAGRRPGRVVAAPDRASRILARAAAQHLGLPLVPWQDLAGQPPSGLVVAWTLDTVGDHAFLMALRDHAPDQVLFTHASSWVDPFPYAPDVTTLLYQHVTHPWTGGALTVVDGEVQQSAPDERPEEVLAEEILSAELSDGSKSPTEHVLAVIRALSGLPEDQRLGIARNAGRRYHQRAGSPVPSNRFL